MAPSTPPGNSNLQAETLELFARLCHMRDSWAGVFALGVGLDDAGRAAAMALQGVGAASLFLEADAGLLTAAGRDGCLSFTVTALDEALRILKNQVRVGRAVTVGLGGDSAGWLAEMRERGVVPDVLVGDLAVDAAAERVGLDVAESMAERRVRDAAIDVGDPVMARWMAVAPLLFPRDRVRAFLKR